MTDITPAFISAKLAQRAEDLVRELLPAGRRIKNDWCVGSVEGEPGESMKICLDNKDQPERIGRWSDFAKGDTSGDLIDLIAQVKKLDIGKAIRFAREWLGIERTEWTARKKQAYVEPSRPKNAKAVANSAPVSAWLASRKISPEVQKKFMLVADGDGTVVFPYMRDGKLLHLKYRDIRQKKFWSSPGTEPCLFGWHALEPQVRTMVLVEGEMDCLAMHEYGFQAMSVPFGAGKQGKQDWIENEWENLERFDTIYLAVDMDGAGIQTVQELAERLGRERCRHVKLPRKDANDCLMHGVAKAEILAAIREAKTLDPAELRNAGDFTNEVMDRFYPTDKTMQGFLMPWLSMAESFHFGWGETTMIAGYSGHGKSELCGQFVLDAMRQTHRACVASFEFKSSKWIKRLVRQATGVELPPREDVLRTMDWLSKSLWAIDLYGSAKADRLLDIFSYAHRRYGTKIFVIDNFTKLGIADDDLAEQKRVMNAITEFAVRHNVHVFIVHHLRKAETDYNPAEMSKQALKGSSTLGDLSDNVWLGWRNLKKEMMLKDPAFNNRSPEEQDEIRRRPDTLLTCEKWREGDEHPRLGLYFDRRSHTWVEIQGATPYVYVKPTKTEPPPAAKTVTRTWRVKGTNPESASQEQHQPASAEDEVPT